MGDSTQRLLKANVPVEECRNIERILRQNNISYFEKWKNHKSLFGREDFKHAKCDIYIHMDFVRKARTALGMPVED
jgi:hypothetical protein